MRDEIKRLRATELAVTDDPTAKVVQLLRRVGAPRAAADGGTGSKVHKPDLDEMGIALYHEVKPARVGRQRPRASPRSMKWVRAWIYSRGKADAKRTAAGPRSTLGRPGMRGGWKPSRKR